MFYQRYTTYDIPLLTGADRFAKDIELMTGRKSSVMLRVFWCIFMTGSLTVSALELTHKPNCYAITFTTHPYLLNPLQHSSVLYQR